MGEKSKELEPDVIGSSALLTTTMFYYVYNRQDIE